MTSGRVNLILYLKRIIEIRDIEISMRKIPDLTVFSNSSVNNECQ